MELDSCIINHALFMFGTFFKLLNRWVEFQKVLPDKLTGIAALLMTNPHDFVKTWGDVDSAVRRISARCEVCKDPTDRVFSEATEAEKLAEIKESFEEEAIQFRLAIIRERLKQEKRDSWLRRSAYYYMGLVKH